MTDRLFLMTIDLTDKMRVRADGQPVGMFLSHLEIRREDTMDYECRMDIGLKATGGATAQAFLDGVRRHIMTNTPLRVTFDDLTYEGRLQTADFHFTSTSGVYPQTLVVYVNRVKELG